MKKFRKQIHESFFNPLLHFLPLLTFLVVDDYYGLQTAWMYSVGIASILLVFVNLVYNKIFEWFLGSVGIFLLMVILITVLSNLPINQNYRHIAGEYLVFLFLFLSLIFRKKIEKYISIRNNQKLSMINNLNEHFRMIWIFTIVFFCYAHYFLIIELFGLKNQIPSLFHTIYLGALFFIIFYEIIRVSIIRIHLLDEVWWPIVSEQGKVIGSVQSQISLNGDRKFMHPIVRLVMINDNKILLQKYNQRDKEFSGLWDTAISNHILITETMDKCIQRTAKDQYGIPEIKYVFLSNYVHETSSEYQYAFLLVACNTTQYSINQNNVEQNKWWTQNQIEDNINTGIFTENFLLEFDILKRSGILAPGICECECRLKETIFHTDLIVKRSI